MNSLDKNLNDYVALLLKITSPFFPYGSILGELISSIIPNQQIDRIKETILVLDNTLKALPENIIKNLVNDREAINLIEEAIIYSTEPISNERRAYIFSIVSKGISKQDIEAIDSRHILKMMKSLNDREILLLRYFSNRTMSGDQDFRKSNKDAICISPPPLSADIQIKNKYIINMNYIKNLVNLGLITKSKLVSKNNGFQNNNISLENSSFYTTEFGHLILRKIGITDSE